MIFQDYYTAEELAATKEVHVKSVYRWVRQGVAPAHELIGRMYWFDKKAADAWRKPRMGRAKKS